MRRLARSSTRLLRAAEAGRTTQARGLFLRLRQAIIRGELRPGDRLVELKVAHRFGLSRASAREALKLLELEGFVKAVPRQGYVVPGITIRQIKELFDLRLLLEREAAARAARRATPQELDELERLVGDPYAPGDPESYRRFLSQNKVFHAAVARLARNERVATIVESLLDELERLFHLGLDVRDRAEALIQEHRDLVAAIRAGDPEQASRLASAQVQNSYEMVLEGIMQGEVSADAGVGSSTAPAQNR